MIWTEWENGHTHVAHFFNDHSVSNREEKTISFISILSIVYKKVKWQAIKRLNKVAVFFSIVLQTTLKLKENN